MHSLHQHTVLLDTILSSCGKLDIASFPSKSDIMVAPPFLFILKRIGEIATLLQRLPFKASIVAAMTRLPGSS